MSKKPASSAVRVKQRRLSPDERRKDFIQKATEFFADEGFGGGTRELAKRLGVTQPLLYRYFPNKEELIKEVYRTVYLEPLNNGWEKGLTDRSVPIRDRLQQFYEDYTDVIFDRNWLRIYLFSGLKGLEINRLYISIVRDKILTRVIKELRFAAGRAASSKPTAAEMEMAWVFHGSIFYYGLRRYIYEAPVQHEKETMISNALDLYLIAVNRMYADLGRPARKARPAA